MLVIALVIKIILLSQIVTEDQIARSMISEHLYPNAQMLNLHIYKWNMIAYQVIFRKSQNVSQKYIIFIFFIPVALPFKPMCGQAFTARSGIINTNNYPSYSNQPSCLATITTTASENIIKAYIIDMSIQE